jgi:SAM-dependent methyltransferase
MKEAQDHFSQASESYRTFRPEYPQELYNWILEYCLIRNSAWDCATGNGQVAKVIAQYFDQVIASDISTQQLQHAHQANNIFYLQGRSEQTHFLDSSFDLITVAQAIHWFDHTAFNKEINRVLKPEGNLAIWGYHLLRINPKVDAILDHFYHEIVGPYWADERKHVDLRYESISIDMPLLHSRDDMSIEVEWNMSQFFGYLSTWSASKTFAVERNKNPVIEIQSQVEEIWKAEEILTVQFPLFAKLYRNI